MPKISSGKFAYFICNSDQYDNPILGDDDLRLELSSSQIFNLVLNKIESKVNPTAISTKYLKFLKDNFFHLSTILNLYDVNSFQRDHYLFLYAFSSDAEYEDSVKFNKLISKKYGHCAFIPFALDNDTGGRLVLLSELREFLTSLYGATVLSEKNLELSKKFQKIYEGDLLDKFMKVVNFKSRNSEDLELLLDVCQTQAKSILTAGW